MLHVLIGHRYVCMYIYIVLWLAFKNLIACAYLVT